MTSKYMMLLGFFGLSAQVAAEDQTIAAKVGFLGLGVEYTYSVSERFGIRGGINGATYGFDAIESDIAYDFDLVWDSLSVAVDFHPTRKPFRVSAGLLSNDNGLDATSRLASAIVVGGTTYTPAEVGTLTAKIGFDSVAPFVGLGWDWSRNLSKFGVSFDLGVVSQGAPELTLTASGTLLGDPIFNADLIAKRNELQRALDDFDLLPFATLGFVFKF
jgi:hypothetical protein